MTLLQVREQCSKMSTESSSEEGTSTPTFSKSGNYSKQEDEFISPLDGTEVSNLSRLMNESLTLETKVSYYYPKPNFVTLKAYPFWGNH